MLTSCEHDFVYDPISLLTNRIERCGHFINASLGDHSLGYYGAVQSVEFQRLTFCKHARVYEYAGDPLPVSVNHHCMLTHHVGGARTVSCTTTAQFHDFGKEAARKNTVLRN